MNVHPTESTLTQQAQRMAAVQRIGLWAAVLAGLLASPAQALQIVDARDGETVFAKVSRQEITRIGFEHSRVRKVTGNAGEFLLEKDEARGQVFIRPSDPHSTKPINLFVSSEHHTVALLLQPVDLPSDTIVIREARLHPKAGGSTGNGTENHGQQHVRQLKNLLVALAGDHLPEDMVVEELGAKTSQPWPAQPGLLLTLQRRLVGEHLVAEKSLITHLGTAPRTVDESMLFTPGVMAISLEQRHLQPGQSSAVFVIRERQVHE